jgi:hypothetical protein
MVDYNALAQAMDTSWGKSSTPLTSTHSVKMQLVGEGRLKVNFAMIVNFRSSPEFIETKVRCSREATNIIAEVIKQIKASYKELTGKSLSFKSVGSDDGVEIIGLGVYNPKRTAYFRRTELYEIG